jgi:hypothetical protein
MRSPRFLALLSAAVLATACGEDDFSGLRPQLEVSPATPVDSSGRAEYLVDFGDVLVGRQGLRFVMVRNLGRVQMAVPAVALEAPFSTDLLAQRLVAAQGELTMGFTFAPTAEGAQELVFTLATDGGDATFRLVGKGVAATSDECVFSVGPSPLEFGNVQRGTTRTLPLVIDNVGSGPCLVRRLTLDRAGDPAFSITSEQAAEITVAPGASLEVVVAFAPTRFWPRFETKVQFWIGPPEEVVEVPVTGASPEPCPGALPDGSCPVPTELVYANTASALFSHDPIANTTRKVGDFRNGTTAVTSMTDIGVDNAGVMMGVDSSRRLFVINPATAACQLVATLPGTAWPGLTFLPDGRLVVAGATVEEIDRSTGRILRTIVASGAFTTSGDIVGLPDGMLYWAVTGSGGDRLVQVNPNTGATTVIGSMGVGSVFGLGYANDTLYGYTSGGRVITIDPRTAAAASSNLVGTWWGAASNPVRW